MEKTRGRLRIGASWAFSIAAHMIILFSASLFVTEALIPPTQLNVKLALPEYVSKPAPSDMGIRHRILSDTQFEPRDADYLSSWRAYIESQGTARYKAALKKNPQLKGELSLRVSIDSQGRLIKVVIEKTSGNAALDKLALQIVKDAAPFEPLPMAMQKDTDVLDILRTWKFN